MNRWSALALLVILAGALAFRLPQLTNRPLHNDEAVNAVKVTELWQNGNYVYDPDEYHGPTLHYATLPFLWLSGSDDANELDDVVLRIAPVVFGVGLILLLLLLFDGLGRPALVWAAIFTAVSPAMVFYSRYFIHEMLLVFFTALTIGAGWRYSQTRSPGWAVMAGVGLGLMATTKETFVLALAAMGAAAAVTLWRNSKAQHGAQLANESPLPLPTPKNQASWNTKHAALFVFSGLVVWILLFSSFFTNAAGTLDSVLTYLPWLERAGGDSPHIHPWFFYLERLVWFHPKKSPVWSEGLIVALALVGTMVSLAGKKKTLHRFLALYTVFLTTIYCVISYKTPWCLLGFYYGMILLAGIGAAALVEFCRSRGLKIIVIGAIGALTLQLSWQTCRANFVFPADPRNPYVYAQTSPDLIQLMDRVEGIAGVASTGYDTVVKVISPDSDYWPMPWYLRRFQRIGWYEQLPQDPFAPIMLVSSTLNARLDDQSNRKWIMAGYTQLRPGTFLELYVELELWKDYVATLPRDRD